MAVEHRVNPNSYNRILNHNLGFEGTIDPNAHANWRWMWVWPLIAVLFLWWAGWGWGHSGGWWFGHLHPDYSSVAASNSHPYQPEYVTGSEVLASREKVMFIGQRFQADNVPVQKRVNARALWIGQGNPMLAIVNGTVIANARNTGPWKEVNAVGFIKQAPPPDQAKQQWALSDQDMSQLEKQGAYIELSELSSPQSTVD